MLTNYINFKIFFISLAIGLLFVYLWQPRPTIVYVYPTPDNIDKLYYKDKADNCHKFRANEIKCPRDKTKIQNIPMQNNE